MFHLNVVDLIYSDVNELLLLQRVSYYLSACLFVPFDNSLKNHESRGWIVPVFTYVSVPSFHTICERIIW